MSELSRRKMMRLAGGLTAGILLRRNLLSAAPVVSSIKAIAFDAFPVFDPRPVFKTVIELFPEQGKSFVESWQAKLFSYQWLRTMGERYKSFPLIAKDALEAAAAQSGLKLTDEARAAILNKYDSITIWPDVLPALQELKAAGLQLCFLSNMTEQMLRLGMKNAGIEHLFSHVISTDAAHTYKPAPVAYQMATDTLRLRKSEILFVAFAGWDAAGAGWFGYPTYWVNRLGAPPDNLDAVPDGTGRDLTGLPEFLKAFRR